MSNTDRQLRPTQKVVMVRCGFNPGAGDTYHAHSFLLAGDPNTPDPIETSQPTALPQLLKLGWVITSVTAAGVAPSGATVGAETGGGSMYLVVLAKDV